MNTNIYRHAFALAYQALWEERFAIPMSRFFPKISEHFQIRGTTFVDIACGTGRFAYELVKQGYRGIGIDSSPAMIGLARQRVTQETLALTFEVQDMRHFQLRCPVDFIMCWFDSINYLATLEEVRAVLEACYRSLKSGGALLFDTETLFSFRDRWGSHKPFSAALGEVLGVCVRGDLHHALYLLRDIWFSRHGQSVRTFVSKEATVQAISQFDHINDRLITTLIGSVRSGEKRLHISESHVQKAFNIGSIENCLYDAGFSPVYIFRLPDFALPTEEEKHVYCCAFKSRK